MAGTVRISRGAAERTSPRVVEPGELDRSPTALARERDALIGSTLVDRYLVEAELGRGGMGTVYRARHVVLDKPVALKILHAEIADDGESRERFLREARIAAAVKHEHLVDVSDFGELTRRELPELGSNRRPWFVLELLEGETLATRLDRDGPLGALEAARIFEQVARGLGAAHRAGAVHRDVKPDNVFLSKKDGRSIVKVLDFGVARLLSASRLTRQGVVFGSPHYMSPEQAAGQEIDGRSDVYSVGVALYETLSGRLPFEADSTSGVLTQHVFVEPDPIEAVVRDPASLGALGAVVMRCLQKRPDARYESADELADALAQVGRATQAGRRAPARSGDPSARVVGSPSGAHDAALAPRPRAVIIVPAVLLAAIACALGALVWMRGRGAHDASSGAQRASSEARVDEPRAASDLGPSRSSSLEPRQAPSGGTAPLAIDAPPTVTAPATPPRLSGSLAAPSRASGPSPTASTPPASSQGAGTPRPAASVAPPLEQVAAPAAPSAVPAATSELIEIF